MNKRILLIAPIDNERISGPLASVTLLAINLKGAGWQTEVYSSCKLGSFKHNGVDVNGLSKEILKGDVYILTGMFHVKTILLTIVLLLFRKKVIFSARGNLTLSALKKGKLKKKIFLNFFMMSILNRCTVHYLSNDEKNASLRVSENFFIAPNFYQDNIMCRYISDPIVRENKILFVGRFDVNHKGLDIFLNFFYTHRDIFECNKVRAELVGPDYRNGKKRVLEEINLYGMSEMVTISEPLFNSDLKKAYREAKYFIHTSRYEGVPQSLIDAYLNGCKIIGSKGCNVPEILRESPNYIDYDDPLFRDWFLKSLSNDLPSRNKYYKNEEILAFYMDGIK